MFEITKTSQGYIIRKGDVFISLTIEEAHEFMGRVRMDRLEKGKEKYE